MTSTLMTPTEELLKDYLVGVEYWSPDMGDSHEVIGARELLAKRALSEYQHAQLVAADDRVLSLAKLHPDDPDNWDIRMLHEMVKIIEAERQAAA